MELMVVIAIIGIFASIVLVPLNNARNKSKNASAKTSMSDIRIFANIFQIDNGYSYNNGMTNVCNNAPQVTILRTAAGGQTGNPTDCSSSSSAYAVWVQLRSPGTIYFCVDSNGFSGEISSIPSAQSCQ